jgi:branched-chain amino acid transport system substrate-binding protein
MKGPSRAGRVTPLVAGLIAVIIVLAGLLGYVATTSQGQL